MPTLPGLTPSSVGPGPVQQNPQAVPVSDPRGEALSSLGRNLRDVGSYLLENYQESRADKHFAKTQKRLQDFEFQMKHGFLAEDGTQVEPPDPADHLTLYEQEVERINKEADSELSGSARSRFDAQFQNFTARQRLTVMTNQAELLDSKTRANAEEALQQHAISYVDAGELEKPVIQKTVFDSIDRMVASGAYSPEEGQARKKKWADDAEEGSFRKILLNNPQDAILALQKGEFSNIAVDKRQRFMTMAFDEWNRRLEKENREAERQERKARRDQKDTEDEMAKQAENLLAKGDLTSGWVMENQDNLSKEDYKFYLRQATGRGDVDQDEAYAGDLLERSLYGGSEKLIREAKSAAAQGRITGATRNKILDNVARLGSAFTGKNLFARGRDYIAGQLAPIPGVLDPAKDARRVNALDRWTQWTLENPDATPEKAEKEWTSLAREAALMSVSDMLLSRPRLRLADPSLSPSDYTWEMLEEEKKKVLDALDQEQMSPTDAAYQLKILKELRQLVPKPPPKPQSTEGVK